MKPSCLKYFCVCVCVHVIIGCNTCTYIHYICCCYCFISLKLQAWCSLQLMWWRWWGIASCHIGSWLWFGLLLVVSREKWGRALADSDSPALAQACQDMGHWPPDSAVPYSHETVINNKSYQICYMLKIPLNFVLWCIALTLRLVLKCLIKRTATVIHALNSRIMLPKLVSVQYKTPAWS